MITQIVAYLLGGLIVLIVFRKLAPAFKDDTVGQLAVFLFWPSAVGVMLALCVLVPGAFLIQELMEVFKRDR